MFVTLFPLWLLLGAGLALWHPPSVTWFLRAGLVTPGLGVIMLGMGLTLTAADFRRVARRPGAAFAGLALQYTIMPLSGLAAAQALALPRPLAAGLILVCCCPGGTASNVIAFLARADLPLSVSMTALSTLVAPVATPLLATWLLGDRVAVDGWGLVRDTALVVLLPVGAGVLLRQRAPGLTRALLPVAPGAAVVVTVLIVSSVIGASRAALVQAGLPLVVAALSAHGLGFLLGYWPARLAGRPVLARTLSIEVGMQNSGLGVVLARGHFTDPLVAVPAALSSLLHSAIGSLLAAWWSRRPAAPQSTSQRDPI